MKRCGNIQQCFKLTNSYTSSGLRRDVKLTLTFVWSGRSRISLMLSGNPSSNLGRTLRPLLLWPFFFGVLGVCLRDCLASAMEEQGDIESFYFMDAIIDACFVLSASRKIIVVVSSNFRRIFSCF